MTVKQGYCAGTLIGFCVQRSLGACKVLFNENSFTDFSKVEAPYMLL